MTSPPTVRLAGVRKSYRGCGEVLAGIDIDVVPGRPVVVLGGNGAGKSTLLRIAAGCSAPTAGSVRGLPAVVGYLPGRVPASTRMPVRAYLRHLAALHGAAPAAAARRAATLLGELDFTGDLDSPVAQLSTGNAQKVGLAQALSCGAELLVLDEPWSGLDARAAEVLVHLLVDEVERGVALLVADHTGRADLLPAAVVLRLAGGVPAADPVGGPHTVVELACPGDPADALAALAPLAQYWTDQGQLTVRVPTDRGDALLAAALSAGCSVLGVRREAR